MSIDIHRLAMCEKPREKFLCHGPQSVTDQDLLAILLRTGIKGHSVLDISRSMIRSLPGENIYYLSESSVNDLCCIHGVGRDKAVTVCAAIELGRRIARQRVKQRAPDFSTPEAIAEYVMEDMRFLPQERFAAVYLSTKNQLITYQTLTIGTLNASLAKARDVFRFAIRYNAAAIVLIHNHPSGNPEPSKDDILVTQNIAEAGRVMDIPVLDHIIIGDGTFVSLCERGYL
ncbi:DNA repair protein RadC [Megasphaera cerevisiae DSM 20462]|uniref:DNA repair protein RadC n=1 Tax=Megasphaera cerevisiae DSM 20462 TaxID=1122219 RepID=A0A0J6WYK4_9FIRM|nr:DNA repair protein RadC [Megasphaera cerevisiae]KMO87338.1 DNA repair protein RadC [Megasphaera cerevisiae DSM 20462]MCI1749977.1 DNA repair protein RadC [Megasphaera cerevisiae]SJZ39686.1 DNA replication and repair protein RadC [Megasphaera cerevisiae DSM 20462]